MSQSPAGSVGSQNRFRSPLGNQPKQNTTVTKPKAIVQQPSPGGRSNASNNSKASNSSNRLYSPSGRVRNPPQPTGLYGSNQTSG